MQPAEISLMKARTAELLSVKIEHSPELTNIAEVTKPGLASSRGAIFLNGRKLDPETSQLDAVFRIPPPSLNPTKVEWPSNHIEDEALTLEYVPESIDSAPEPRPYSAGV
ncbi:hypothetical protein EMPG_11983 [Blastomyces silverae]|uniref:Uncharacterized protein n=1 Tax=Blastomyces silverae TaxID=2060906 RepID=A0A0H1BVG3_9EURO|nr:hypothetical protein EMPG_11983 [Blastomyces silverae]